MKHKEYIFRICIGIITGTLTFSAGAWQRLSTVLCPVPSLLALEARALAGIIPGVAGLEGELNTVFPYECEGGLVGSLNSVWVLTSGALGKGLHRGSCYSP